MSQPTLLYLHGFLSSPQSKKATLLKEWLAVNCPDIRYLCPELSSYPGKAIARIKLLQEANKQAHIAVVGSSLGGYWATWMAEYYGVKAVLINPAVQPSMLEAHYLNVPIKNFYNDEVIRLTEQDLADLRSVEVCTPTQKDRIWLLAQTGDTTCDYRLALNKYSKCRQTIEVGGDHGFEQFERHIPAILEFFEF